MTIIRLSINRLGSQLKVEMKSVIKIVSDCGHPMTQLENNEISQFHLTLKITISMINNSLAEQQVWRCNI